MSDEHKKADVEDLIEHCKLNGILGDQLDDLVIDGKCEEASLINNEGLAAQLEYLLDSWRTKQEVLNLLDALGSSYPVESDD